MTGLFLQSQFHLIGPLEFSLLERRFQSYGNSFSMYLKLLNVVVGSCSSVAFVPDKSLAAFLSSSYLDGVSLETEDMITKFWNLKPSPELASITSDEMPHLRRSESPEMLDRVSPKKDEWEVIEADESIAAFVDLSTPEQTGINSWLNSLLKPIAKLVVKSEGST